MARSPLPAPSGADDTGASETPARPRLEHRLFTITTYPIRYLVIPKCGCTFVKNLLWRLEKGAVHRNPLRIHDDDKLFLRASDLGLGEAELRAEEHAFTVLRNPVDRFFSLYREKIVGPGHRNFVPLREILAERHGLDVAAATASEHRRNCEILADWLERNLRERIDIKPESHWTPQVYRCDVMARFDLKILTLNALSEQLLMLLGPLVPDLEDIMGEIERNGSTSDIVKSDVLTPAIRRKINALYDRDRHLFVRARDRWASLPATGAGPAEAPRYSDLQDDAASS